LRCLLRTKSLQDSKVDKTSEMVIDLNDIISTNLGSGHYNTLDVVIDLKDVILTNFG